MEPPEAELCGTCWLMFCLCCILSERSFRLAISSFIRTASSFESTSILEMKRWRRVFLSMRGSSRSLLMMLS